MGWYIDAGALSAAVAGCPCQLFYTRSPGAFRFNYLGQIRGPGAMSLLSGAADSNSTGCNHSTDRSPITSHHAGVNDSCSHCADCGECATRKEVMIYALIRAGTSPAP